MVSARYAGFLQRSLPPFWPTTNRALVLQALQRLDESAAPPLPVAEPARRGVGGAAAGASDPVTGPAAEAADPDGAPHARPVAPDPPPAESARSAVTLGHPWSEQDDEELRDGIEMGLTLAELSESLEVPEDVVAARLDGLGLTAATSPQSTWD